MTDTRWRHPREYRDEPVCGVGISCRSVWPNCVTARKVFGLDRSKACKIACQEYVWVECNECVGEIRKEQEHVR